MDVGFIGTGHMGIHMARNMIRAGYQLVVHDLREEATVSLQDLGARWADSPKAVAGQCEVIFTSLPGPPEVERVVLGPDGILEGARPGTVLFDLSTNYPGGIRPVAEAARKKGVDILDAPVANAVRGAEEGTLTVMVGGTREAFDKYKPLLEAIGNNIFYLGKLGNGYVAKLTNNLLLMATSQIMQEGVLMGVKAGLDPETIYEVLNVSSASRLIQGLPRLLERQFDDPSFALELAGKDVRLAVQLGRELKFPMPISAAAEQNFLRAEARGLGKKSPQATLLPLEEVAGVELRARQGKANSRT